MFWRLVQGRPGPNWLGFYGLVGLAFWTKGVAGLMPLAFALVYATRVPARRDVARAPPAGGHRAGRRPRRALVVRHWLSDERRIPHGRRSRQPGLVHAAHR